jgi:hypothetical protein
MDNKKQQKLVYMINEFTEEDEPPSTISLSNDEAEVSIRFNKVGARVSNERIGISQKSLDFLRKYYPSASEKDWNSWQWQVKNNYAKFSPYQNRSYLLSITISMLSR